MGKKVVAKPGCPLTEGIHLPGEMVHGPTDVMDTFLDDKEDLSELDSIWHLQRCLESINLYQPKMSNLLTVGYKDSTKISPVKRNQSAVNLKCLTAFYGFPSEVFCLALSTLDRFITKVKVQPRYLSCITTTCFYNAVKAIQGHQNAPSLDKLIRVSQCDCRSGDINRMETIILDKLRPAPSADTITPLLVLQAMVEAFCQLSHVDLSNHMNKLSSKLLMCLCHAELLDISMEVIALAVLGAHLQQHGMDHNQAAVFTTLLNICQVSDREYIPYQEQVVQFLDENYAAPSHLPKLQLKWTISNRTMSMLRPYNSWYTELPVIPETPYDSADLRASSLESIPDMEIDDDEYIPGTPTPEDFTNHFSYPNSPSEPSPISAGLPCPILTYADVVSGRLYQH